MKINVKDVFEKDDKNIHVHTNDRLDIDEVFAEAGVDHPHKEQVTSNEAESISKPVEAETIPASDEAAAEEISEGTAQETAEEDSSEETVEEQTVEEQTELPESEQQAQQPSCQRYKDYIPHAVITGVFALLLLVVVVYSTMIPREVNATINGEQFTFSSKAHTVQGFLEDENIAFHDEDYISVPLTAFIYDGMQFKIEHATEFKVTADGKTKSYKTLANTVGAALKDANIRLGENDIVSPDANAMLTKDMNIIVKRVQIKEEVIQEAVPFKTVKKDDSSLNEGTTKVVTEGVDGKDLVTYQITYIDGVESSRKELSRTAVTKAVDEVVARGTRINFDGKTYSRKLVVKAYAYTGGGRTAMGTRARVGEIAVDPGVIPLGTNVYIEGVGPRRAEDTGGNIKGNTIDIYMDTESQCRSWGVRYVTIYIQ